MAEIQESIPLPILRQSFGVQGHILASQDELPLDPETELGSSLPPADTGLHAWLYLLSAFILEASVWGFAFTFGVFQDYYSHHSLFSGHASSFASIGTAQTGIIYIGMLPIVYSLLKFPKFRPYSLPIGLLLMCCGLAISSFATTVEVLLLTQGLMYGLGGALAYCPALLFLGEWFVRRQGLALGLMWAGTGLAGVIFPFIISAALQKYGFRTTLRVWSVILLVLVAPLTRFVKPRIPTSQPRRFSFDFLRSPAFILFQVGNVIQGLGCYFPQIYMPSIAAQLGASQFLATLSIVLLNLATVASYVIMGSLNDRLHVTTCIAICSIGACIASFVFWGTSTNIGLLYVFAIVYGFFGGSFPVSYSGIVRLMGRTVARTEPGIVMGTLFLGRGLGNTISGPLSSALLSANNWGHLKLAYGSGYGPLIVFTGCSALFGGISALARLKVGFYPVD